MLKITKGTNTVAGMVFPGSRESGEKEVCEAFECREIAEEKNAERFRMRP